MRDIIIIAAVAENNVIGKDNKMIWHLPNDLKRFKKLTQGHHIIMGRKTFESFPGKLPNRTHVIISRNKNYQADGCIVVGSLEEAIEACPKSEDIFIIGGEQIYNLGMKIATKMKLTLVKESFIGDTFFPIPSALDWEVIGLIEMSKDENHNHDYEFITLTRIRWEK